MRLKYAVPAVRHLIKGGTAACTRQVPRLRKLSSQMRRKASPIPEWGRNCRRNCPYQKGTKGFRKRRYDSRLSQSHEFDAAQISTKEMIATSLKARRRKNQQLTNWKARKKRLAKGKTRKSLLQ
jgi:hypothetical protein